MHYLVIIIGIGFIHNPFEYTCASPISFSAMPTHYFRMICSEKQVLLQKMESAILPISISMIWSDRLKLTFIAKMLQLSCLVRLARASQQTTFRALQL